MEVLFNELEIPVEEYSFVDQRYSLETQEQYVILHLCYNHVSKFLKDV